jgi:cytochrome P450
MSPYAFTPFSIGARGCIGQHFALLTSKIVLIKFISRFSLRVQDGY